MHGRNTHRMTFRPSKTKTKGKLKLKLLTSQRHAATSDRHRQQPPTTNHREADLPNSSLGGDEPTPSFRQPKLTSTSSEIRLQVLAAQRAAAEADGIEYDPSEAKSDAGGAQGFTLVCRRSSALYARVPLLQRRLPFFVFSNRLLPPSLLPSFSLSLSLSSPNYHSSSSALISKSSVPKTSAVKLG
jgi:hypothetical protein